MFFLKLNMMRGLLCLSKWCPQYKVPKVVAKQPDEFSGDSLLRNLEVGEAMIYP